MWSDVEKNVFCGTKIVPHLEIRKPRAILLKAIDRLQTEGNSDQSSVILLFVVGFSSYFFLCTISRYFTRKAKYEPILSHSQILIVDFRISKDSLAHLGHPKLFDFCECSGRPPSFDRFLLGEVTEVHDYRQAKRLRLETCHNNCGEVSSFTCLSNGELWRNNNLMVPTQCQFHSFG